MNIANHAGIKIGEFVLDPSRHTLSGLQGEVAVEPKVVEVLLALAARPGAVLTRNELVDVVWNGDFGADERLTRVISLLRKAFGDDRGAARYIETVSKRGYRLVADVKRFAGTDAQTPGPSRPTTASIATDALSSNPQAVPSVNSIDAVPTDDPTPKAFAPGWRSWSVHTSVAVIVIAIAIAAAVAVSIFIIRRDGVDDAAEGVAAGYTVHLAVIPFTAISSNPDDQHFAEGLSEELLNWLANVEGLRVRGPISSYYFRGKGADLHEIRKRLGVDYVLEGSVRKSEVTLRIAAQLIDVRTGYHLWSEVYERGRSDIIAIQDDIARIIVTELLGKIPEAGVTNPAGVGDVDPRAHELYLEGRTLWATRQGMNALRKFREAVAIDPRHAFAQAYFAVIAANMQANDISPAGLDKPDAAITKALAEAVKLKPKAADVLFAKAWVAESRSGKLPGSVITDRSIIDVYGAAVRANPRHVEALHALTRAEPSPEKRIALYERILEIDPSHPAARGNLAQAYQATGNRAKAALVIHEGLVATPDKRGFWAARAKVLGDLQLFGEAAFGDWDAFNRQGYLRMMAASLLADLGAASEARYLSKKETANGDPTWREYSRIAVATLDGDAEAERAAAETFHAGARALRYSTWMLPNALVRMGDYARAYDLIAERRPDIAGAKVKQEDRHWDEFSDLKFVTATHALELAGRREEARTLWKEALARVETEPQTAGWGWMDFLYLALIQSRLGNNAKAVRAFRAAYDAGFRYLAGYNCSLCIYDGFSAERGLFSELAAIPGASAIIEQIKADNTKTLERFNKQYGVLDKVREMMVEGAAARD